MNRKSFSFRYFSRGVQISESSVKMLLHHSTSRFTFGVKQNHNIIDCLRLNEISGHPPSCSGRATCLLWTMTLADFRCSEETSCVSVLCLFSCLWVPLRAWVHFRCTLLSCNLARNSLFIHSDLPAYLADFVFVQMEPELGRGDF